MNRLIARPGCLNFASLALLVVAFAFPAQGQTYSVGGAQNTQANTQTKNGQAAPSGQLGFGSNIQNARLARAAQLALQKGDHALAVNYAQRAVQAAPNDPQLWFLLGYAARLDGKYQLALDSYNHGLKLKPGAVEGLSGLAQTYSLTGQVDEAERLLKQVIAENPNRPDDALLLGNLYMRAGDYQGSLEWLRRAEQERASARSELLLAISYQHLKQMDQASRYLEMAKKRSPNNPEVMRSLAGYYRTLGNYKDAIATLKSIRNPQPDVIAELAYTYQLAGQADQAAAIYAKAADAKPGDLGLQLSAAQAEVAAGTMERADPFLKRAEGLDPNYYRLHAIRGEIAQLQDHDEDAVTEYKAALAHLPATPVEGPLYGIQLHVDLMELYHTLNDQSAANQELATAQTEINALNEQGADRGSFLRLRALIKMNADDLDGGLADIKEALALAPKDPNNLQLNGDLLMKMGRTEDAINVYKQILAMDPRNRGALTSIGYASRTAGRDEDAQKYFDRLAQAYPNLYVPYLALGDMYTAHHDYKKADANYRKAFALAPRNASIVAGALNASIEGHDLKLGGVWMDRVTVAMQQQPQVLREMERYLSFKGDYKGSAEVGERAIKVLPQDRDVVIYLGYDLLYLNRYDDLLQLTQKYMTVLPKEPDLPLLAGYVEKHNNKLDEAQQDFTETLKRDPNVVTAYVNLGYVENDLHQPGPASDNFDEALKRDPKNGEAHLGLAYSDLDLLKPAEALRQADLAQRYMGDGEPVHVIRATAYGREGMLSKAAAEYRAALKFDPHNGLLYFGLGNTLFSERQYHQAVDTLQTAARLTPGNPEISALTARAYASLNDRPQTMRYVQLAEQQARQLPPTGPNGYVNPAGSELSQIYISTGQALSTLGDQKAAMERFRLALIAPGSNRISVRLAIAELMAQQDHSQDAQRQIALALMESEAGQAPPPTGDQFIQAADVFRSLHEYKLSETYLERAQMAGASEISVRIGMANSYLALGETSRAAAELSAVSNSGDPESDYRYLLAEANVYQQEHQSTQALTAFAQAASDAGEDQSAEQSLLQAGANEGYRINPDVSLLSNLIVQGIFEDTTVYVLDSKLDALTPIPPADISGLPTPRSSIETEWTAAFHLHFPYVPTPTGFFQIRNARGTISVPATSSIVNRDTTDYSFNIGVNPTARLGSNVITFNGGIQETVRRDSLEPAALNQNLFRQFVYVSTGSFFDAVSVDGYVIHETGPFTETNENSSALVGAIDFRVGTPWGKNALVTGWGRSDQTFTPVGIEDYYTTSYAGFSRRFSDRLNIAAVAEDLRAWRVVGSRSGIAQALRPAGTINFEPARNWSIQASSIYFSNRGFHVYDATQNSFSLSYARAFHRKFNADTGEVSLEYPIRFSGGLQQETFFNFTQGKNEQFRPFISITVF